MKKFTLIAMALMALSGSVMAQKSFVHKQKKAAKATLMKPAAQGLRRAKAQEKSAALYLPQHEEVFFYEEDWIPMGKYDLIYDQRGNVLTEDFDEDGAVTRTTYVYNENDNWVSKTEASLENGVEQDGASRQIRAFDPIVKDLVTDNSFYTCNAGVWEMSTTNNIWKREVTRDEQKRITSIKMFVYYMGGYDETKRTTITYGTDGRAATWKLEEKTTDDGINFKWVEAYTLTDMEWEMTDGQIVAMDVNEFFTSANFLKRATVSETGYGVVGTIEGTYNGNAGYTYSFNYMEPVEKDVFEVKVLDANGSYEENYYYYSDNDENGSLTDEELVESSQLIVMFDAKGQTLSEEMYFNGELEGGTKYENEYGEYDYPLSIVMSEYDYEAEAYVPSMRIVSSDFIDVTKSSGIYGVTVAGSDSTDGIYNLQGVKLAGNKAGLPSGIYIVKQNGMTKKVVKR